MTRWIAIVAVGALFMSSCGDGDGGGSVSAEDRELVDAITSQIMSDQEPDDELVLTEADARCIASGTVEEFGKGGLVAIGLNIEDIRSGTGPDDVDLSDADALRFVDPYLDCVDVRQLFVDGLTAGATEAEIGEESVQCMIDGMSDDFIRSSVVAGIRGQDFEDLDPALGNDIVKLVTDCFSFEDLLRLGDE